MTEVDKLFGVFKATARLFSSPLEILQGEYHRISSTSIDANRIH